MTPNERGRHCDSCNKTVIDFTLYSEKQLIEFFSNATGRVCGHISAHQLNKVIAVRENNRNTFFKNLIWGTAIAGWLGLADKADAQATHTPVMTEQVIQANKTSNNKQDTLKAYLTLTFIDSATQQIIPELNVSIYSDGFSEYSQTDENGVAQINILRSMIGKKISLTLESNYYLYKAIEIKIPSTPLRKKLPVVIEHAQLLNGGIIYSPKDTNE